MFEISTLAEDFAEKVKGNYVCTKNNRTFEMTFSLVEDVEPSEDEKGSGTIEFRECLGKEKNIGRLWRAPYFMSLDVKVFTSADEAIRALLRESGNAIPVRDQDDDDSEEE